MRTPDPGLRPAIGVLKEQRSKHGESWYSGDGGGSVGGGVVGVVETLVNQHTVNIIAAEPTVSAQLYCVT